MNLLELLTHAQAHDEDAILYLFQKFKSLILKMTRYGAGKMNVIPENEDETVRI